MRRCYNPRRRRLRPGRRPPYRYRTRVRPGGFTGYGVDAYYQWLLPGLHGAEKKAFFNRASLAIPLALAYGGAVVGYGAGGSLGALIGAVAGLTGGCSLAEKERFYRR